MKALLIMALIFSSSVYADVREMIAIDLKEVTVQGMSNAQKNLKMNLQCKGDALFDDILFQTGWFHLPENFGRGPLIVKKSGIKILVGPEFFQKCSEFNRVILSIEDYGFVGATKLVQKDIYRLLYSRSSSLKPGGSVNLKLKGDIEATIRVSSKLVRY